MKVLLFATFVILTTLAPGRSLNTFPVQTTIEQGMIEGNYDTLTGLQVYLGIPFAQPPVGELRWKAPQPPGKWSGVRITKEYGPRAMQPPIYRDMIFESDGLSEDCLYLNVWTPAKRSTTGLPVLVYFYGGGFTAGDGSEPRYNGASMAQKGIVAVTANYRLNIFGSLAHPELSAEAPYKASGNYGLLDQQAVLAWVQKNITAFGGDPKQVTIAGESAGSSSVSLQMASPLSKSLIARAIGESGAAIKPSAPVPLAQAEQIGRDFLTKAGVRSIKDARKLSARDLYELYEETKRPRFPLVIDGYFLPKTLPEIFSAKEQAQVPLLVGWNSAESSGNAFMQGQPYEEAAFVARVKEVFPNHYEEVLKLYPHRSAQELEASATALASDRFIAYSTWRWFDLHRKHSDQPVYRYLYSKLRPPLTEVGLQRQTGAAIGAIKKPIAASPPRAIGAPHACEIEYCLGNLYLIPDYVWSEDDYKVSQTMQTYFANFIKTGNPNSSDLAPWPASKAEDANPPVMVIDVQSAAKNAETDVRYRLLETVYEK